MAETTRPTNSLRRLNFSACPLLAKACDIWLGRIRKHSINEAIRTAITVNGMSRIRSPKRPPTAISPKKAMTVVKVAANTGIAMRLAAPSAASTGDSPKTRARWSACSPTTIASSTTIPNVMINPNRLIMLMVKPPIHMNAIAASKATGIPAATQKAVRALRNKNSKATTRPKPVSALSTNRSRREEIASARVRINSMVTPRGKVSCMASAASWTCACMAIASPVLERSMRTDTAFSSPTK